MKRLLTVLIALLSLAPALAPSAKGGVAKVVDRSLTPYGQWPVIDPKSETFYPVSPYSYCAGDPINYVDPDGKHRIVLTTDKRVTNAYKGLRTDNVFHVIAHGNTKFMEYSKDGKNKISTGRQLVSAIKKNFYSDRDIAKVKAIEIKLHSCNTGHDGENGEEPLGQKFSKDIPNAVIVAPNGFIDVNKRGKEEVYNKDSSDGEKIVETDKPWRLFFRGNEYPIDQKELIMFYLNREEQIKEKQLPFPQIELDFNFPNDK